MTKELERLADVTMDVAILSGAIGFVKIHVEDCRYDYGINRLFDIMYILEQFADKVSNDLIDIEVDLNKAVKGNTKLIADNERG